MYAKKSLGQHFLKSKGALRSIVECSNLTDQDIILEIGPGKGALTEVLLPHIKKIVAVEKDTYLADELEKKFATEISADKLKIIRADILELSDDQLKEVGITAGTYKIIANIPYYITGAIIRMFLSGANQPQLMTLLVQKEVCDRIVARDKKESLLSISVKVYGQPKYIETVKARYFSPPPQVDSAIILIDKISKEYFKTISEETFFKILKASFAHKRKMLQSNLKLLFKSEDIVTVFSTLSLNPKSRPEDLSVGDWQSLTSILAPKLS